MLAKRMILPTWHGGRSIVIYSPGAGHMCPGGGDKKCGGGLFQKRQGDEFVVH